MSIEELLDELEVWDRAKVRWNKEEWARVRVHCAEALRNYRNLTEDQMYRLHSNILRLLLESY